MSRKPEKLPSSPAFRRVAGGVLQIVWILLLLALASYTYRDIAWEYDPPNSPVHNWVGAIGAYAACAVFSLFGLVGFIVPLALALLGIVLWISENRALRTAVWLLVMLLAGAVLVDLRPTLLQNTVVNKLNLGDFSGGWVGWLFGRCALQRLLGPIGAGLLATAFLVAGVFFVSRTRPVELFRGWSDLWHSWRDRSAALADHRDGEDARLRRERAKAERERLRIQREAMKIRAQQEREERKRRQQAERDARRERLAAEREARQQRIAAERERIAAVRESERARAEEERRKAEELRLALQREKAREREEREAERARIAEEERLAEEQRKAEQERIAEEQRLAEEQRHAEAVEQARIAREAAEKERQRLLEERAAAAALPPPSWRLPPMTLLQPIPEGAATAATDGDDVAAHQDTIETIEGTLARFGVEAHVTHVEQGPTVTLFELLPAPDVKVERIAALHRNLTLALKADSVRIQAPIPGKGVVGIEVPRRQPSPVVLRQLLESPQWLTSKASLPLAMGLDVGGQILMADLAKLPHLLIAGATGMGKTVCMNSLLAGLLMTRTPDELKLILVDPKIVEFSGYNGLPHLITPVITEAKKVTAGLKWAISEMEKRFRLFQKAHVRDIQGYNKRPIVTQPTLFDPSPDELPPEPPPPPEPPADGTAPSLADFVVPETDSAEFPAENTDSVENIENIEPSAPDSDS
ncbi:MAG: DNA translocase FtsK, partial [Kiritimatiellae bacterium]|nr:DNA translocase FtsK [Kiritimatiellia bacterium]